MPKALCVIGMIVAGLLILLFGLDAAVGIPFNSASMMMDVGMIVASAIVAYLSWSTFREQT